MAMKADEKMQSFQPHAVIVTERKIPSPIFVAAIFGVDGILRIDFDPDQPPVTYTRQALAGIQQKLAHFKCPSLPGFGKPTGFVVNYSPDHAVRYDLAGNAQEILPSAYRTGKASMSVGP
jgi:hypothetical protein